MQRPHGGRFQPPVTSDLRTQADARSVLQAAGAALDAAQGVEMGAGALVKLKEWAWLLLLPSPARAELGPAAEAFSLTWK